MAKRMFFASSDCLKKEAAQLSICERKTTSTNTTMMVSTKMAAILTIAIMEE